MKERDHYGRRGRFRPERGAARFGSPWSPLSAPTLTKINPRIENPNQSKGIHKTLRMKSEEGKKEKGKGKGRGTSRPR